MARTIPRAKAFYRAAFPVAYRQVLSNNFKYLSSPINHPLLPEDDNEQPVNSLNDFVDWWNFDSFSGSPPNLRTPSFRGTNEFKSASLTTVAGKISNALRLNASGGGTDNLIELNPNDVFGFNATSVTFNFWVKFESFPGFDSKFFGRSNTVTPASQTSGFMAFITSLGRVTLRFTSSLGVNTDLTLSADLSLNTWYMFTILYDRPNDKIFLEYYNESGLIESLNTAPTEYTFTSAQDMGFWRPSTSGMNVIADELGCWTRLLNSDEKLTLFNSGTGKRPPF